jgi:hypothetical protein
VDALELLDEKAGQAKHKYALKLGRLFLIPLLACMAFLPAERILADRIKRGAMVLNGDIKVLPHETVEKDLVSFGGSIQVKGRVQGDVCALGGAMDISGSVTGSVISFGGRVQLGKDAVIEKDVMILGGSLEAAEGCSVRGDMINFPGGGKLGPLFSRDAAADRASSFSPFILGLKCFLILLWLFVSPMVLLIFPKQVVNCSRELESQPLRIGLIGLVAMIFTFLTLFLFLLLSVIFIGIPLLFLLFVVATVIKIFGTVVVFHVIGKKLGRLFGKKAITDMSAMLLGLAFMAVLRFIPIVNLPVWFLLNMFAFGIVLATKFGTLEPWFSRKKTALTRSDYAERLS